MYRDSANLLASKVGRELFRIAQAYGKDHPFSFDDLVHDLGVMLERDALQNVSLQFRRPGPSREILVEYSYALHAGNPRFHLDDAQGLGIVPLSPPFEMGLVAYRTLPGEAFNGQLRLGWGAAPTYTKRGGFEHQDGNTAQRTGGRASKQVYMDHALRRTGQVKFYLPAKQYGFITSAEGVDVFFHINNAPGMTPQKGQLVSYLPLVTPRGVQAKDVRPA